MLENFQLYIVIMSSNIIFNPSTASFTTLTDLKYLITFLTKKSCFSDNKNFPYLRDDSEKWTAPKWEWWQLKQYIKRFFVYWISLPTRSTAICYIFILNFFFNYSFSLTGSLSRNSLFNFRISLSYLKPFFNQLCVHCFW